MCFVGGEMDWITNPTMKRRMFHHLLNHKNQQQNNEKSTNPILSVLEAMEHPYIEGGHGCN